MHTITRWLYVSLCPVHRVFCLLYASSRITASSQRTHSTHECTKQLTPPAAGCMHTAVRQCPVLIFDRTHKQLSSAGQNMIALPAKPKMCNAVVGCLFIWLFPKPRWLTRCCGCCLPSFFLQFSSSVPFPHSSLFSIRWDLHRFLIPYYYPVLIRSASPTGTIVPLLLLNFVPFLFSHLLAFTTRTHTCTTFPLHDTFVPRTPWHRYR